MHPLGSRLHCCGLLGDIAEVRWVWGCENIDELLVYVSFSDLCLSVRRKKLKSCHIDPHKPSKWSQTISNSKKLLCVPD